MKRHVRLLLRVAAGILGFLGLVVALVYFTWPARYSWRGKGQIVLKLPDPLSKRVGDKPFNWAVLRHVPMGDDPDLYLLLSRSPEVVSRKPSPALTRALYTPQVDKQDAAIIAHGLRLPFQPYSDQGRAAFRGRWVLEYQGNVLCIRSVPLNRSIRLGDTSTSFLVDEFYQAYASIHAAIADGDMTEVQALLDERPKLVGSVDHRAWPPLHVAAEAGEVEAIELLLSRGADANAQDERRRVPLPLFLAAKSGKAKAVRLLLSSRAVVDARRWDGRTPLFLAVESGSTEAVRALLSAGAQADARERQSRLPSGKVLFVAQTPLSMAEGRGFDEIADLLREHGAYLRKDIFDAILERDNDRVAALLALDSGLAQARQHRDNPLHTAARHGNAEAVALLIGKGADVNACYPFGSIPLMGAARNGHLGIMKLLVDAGADVNLAQREGNTALHCAMLYHQGPLPQVEFLVSNGADVNAKGYAGKTPLHEAAQMGYLDVVKYLVSKGADVNVSEDDGTTPLQRAKRQRHEDVVGFLVANGAR